MSLGCLSSSVCLSVCWKPSMHACVFRLRQAGRLGTLYYTTPSNNTKQPSLRQDAPQKRRVNVYPYKKTPTLLMSATQDTPLLHIRIIFFMYPTRTYTHPTEAKTYKTDRPLENRRTKQAAQPLPSSFSYNRIPCFVFMIRTSSLPRSQLPFPPHYREFPR
ncbi:hypothetical protein F5X98DRAFT_268782 [Xylaria grammica]|nr:hypothetical protein F5X98DRAFT_268782 [Xylaria grammica]